MNKEQFLNVRNEVRSKLYVGMIYNSDIVLNIIDTALKNNEVKSKPTLKMLNELGIATENYVGAKGSISNLLITAINQPVNS